MAKRVLIMDTSVLCCLLEVPGKETCGTSADPWNKRRVEAVLAAEPGSTRVLPLATLVETGNHIAQAPGDRFSFATVLAGYIEAAANADSPWAAFTDQADLWGVDRLRGLAKEWPKLAATRLSIGDATIKDVAEFYAKAGFDVEIVTGDAGLKAYQPVSKPLIPRRRR